MRTFEIILLLFVSILPFTKRLIIRHIMTKHLLLILGSLLLLHLIIDGWRWQMLPTYLLTIILTWRIKVVDLTKLNKLTFLRISGFVGIAILALISWTLSIIFPVFILPTPRGEYSVGTSTRYELTTMDEIITKDPNDKRELTYRIWYPSEAEVSNLQGIKYLDYGERSGFAVKYGTPPNTLNYLDLVETYAYADIPVAQGQFPVLIFSHGYGSQPTGYFALLTEIASHGYIIINMNHTYEGLGATLPDGSIKYFDYDFQRESSKDTYHIIQPMIDAFKNNLSYEERHPIVKQAIKNYFTKDIENRWAHDMIFTIDLLEEWNTVGHLKNKLDLNKLGVFGHSRGGGSIGKVAIEDRRVKAAANLDGVQWGNMIDTIYHIPYLYISADWPADHPDINAHTYINKSTDIFYESKLLKSGHPNFMDIPFLFPIPAISECGEIDPYLGMEITTKLVTSFFDRHLKYSVSANPELISKQYDLLKMNVYKGDSIK